MFETKINNKHFLVLTASDMKPSEKTMIKYTQKYGNKDISQLSAKLKATKTIEPL